MGKRLRRGAHHGRDALHQPGDLPGLRPEGDPDQGARGVQRRRRARGVDVGEAVAHDHLRHGRVRCFHARGHHRRVRHVEDAPCLHIGRQADRAGQGCSALGGVGQEGREHVTQADGDRGMGHAGLLRGDRPRTAPPPRGGAGPVATVRPLGAWPAGSSRSWPTRRSRGTSGPLRQPRAGRVLASPPRRGRGGRGSSRAAPRASGPVRSGRDRARRVRRRGRRGPPPWRHVRAGRADGGGRSPTWWSAGPSCALLMWSASLTNTVR